MPDTVKIRYIGHCTSGVQIDATGDVVAHGAEVEVPAEVGKGLLAQVDEWAPAGSKLKDTNKGDLNA